VKDRPDITDNTWFSDEAHSYSNAENCHFLGTEKKELYSLNKRTRVTPLSVDTRNICTSFCNRGDVI